MSRHRLIVSLLAAFFVASAAQAQMMTPVALPYNDNLQTSLISTVPSGVFVNQQGYGTPFQIPTTSTASCPVSGPCNYFSDTSFGQSITIDVSVPNATYVDTLLNATAPQDGATLGTIQFIGDGGASATFALIAGHNIRDYFEGNFANNLLDDVPGVEAFNYFACTAPVDCLGSGGTGNVQTGSHGNYFVDQQRFTLDASFASQTLTKIVLTNSTTSSAFLLSGVTVESTGSPPPNTSPLVASLLPGIRAVQGGAVVTAAATMINAGSDPLTGCGIAPNTILPLDFFYQALDPATGQPTGSQNTPVSLAAGAAQNFVVGFAPNAPFPLTELQLSYSCTGVAPAPVTVGLDTFLLLSSATPTPDIVALAATAGNDGIVDIPGASGTGAFSVASINLGSALNNAVVYGYGDSGASDLFITVQICQTDPTSGQCLAPPAPSVTTSIGPGETPTFAFFVTGQNATIPFDPAINRILVNFTDSGLYLLGQTSVAVRTQ